jgi:hypothetical protein
MALFQLLLLSLVESIDWTMSAEWAVAARQLRLRVSAIYFFIVFIL